MKKPLLPLFLLALISPSTFAQGEVFFANRITGSIDARVSLVGPGKPAHDFADSTYNAALAVFRNQTWETVPGSVVPFRGLPGTAANGYITGFNISIPGFAPGTAVLLRMRGFLGPSFEEALASCATAGESAPVTVTLGGGIIPVPNMDGLSPFSIMPCPEPSTIALAILGAAALILRRRK